MFCSSMLLAAMHADPTFFLKLRGENPGLAPEYYFKRVYRYAPLPCEERALPDPNGNCRWSQDRGSNPSVSFFPLEKVSFHLRVPKELGL